MAWKDKVLGIVEGYLNGQASGLALMDILMCDINPSGKLAETFPNYLDEIPRIQKIKPYHLNSTIGKIKHIMIGKMLYKMVRKEYGSIAGDQPTQAMIEMLEASVNEMPLRSLVLFSDGKLSKKRAFGIIDLMHHDFLRGILKLIKG